MDHQDPVFHQHHYPTLTLLAEIFRCRNLPDQVEGRRGQGVGLWRNRLDLAHLETHCEQVPKYTKLYYHNLHPGTPTSMFFNVFVHMRYVAGVYIKSFGA